MSVARYWHSFTPFLFSDIESKRAMANCCRLHLIPGELSRSIVATEMFLQIVAENYSTLEANKARREIAARRRRASR